MFCQKDPTTNNVIKIHLNHSVCKECLENYLFYLNKGNLFTINKKLLEKGCDYPFELIKCPSRSCNYFFQIQTLLVFSKSEIDNEFNEICNKNKRQIMQKPFKICPICRIKKSIDEIVIFKNCNHFACKFCFNKYDYIELLIMK